MEEREEEYQRARERIFAHDVRAVCVGGAGGGGRGEPCCSNLCVVSIHVQILYISCFQLPPLDLSGTGGYFSL